MVTKLCQLARTYVRDMELSDIAAFKVCLLSLGTLIGVALPKKARRILSICASVAFLLTYLPLMARMVQLLFHREDSL